MIHGRLSTAIYQPITATAATKTTTAMMVDGSNSSKGNIYGDSNSNSENNCNCNCKNSNDDDDDSKYKG